MPTAITTTVSRDRGSWRVDIWEDRALVEQRWFLHKPDREMRAYAIREYLRAAGRVEEAA